MRTKISTLLSVLAATVLCLLPAEATARGTPDSVFLDNGTQAMTSGIYFGSIHIDVRSGPRGRFPRGEVVFLISGLQIRAGSPSCLRVRRRNATITFKDEGYVGSPDTVTIQVRDGGPGEPDSIDAALNARALGDCRRLPPTGEQAPLAEGNLRVRDGKRETDV